MDIKRVIGAYFSPTGNTKAIVVATGKALARDEGTSFVDLDLTSPSAREKDFYAEKGDMVIIGFPTYAGRLPNKIMPFVRDRIKGKESLCLALVTYGNRNYDDSLSELFYLMKQNGFTMIGGWALPCEHAFASDLAKGKPTAADLDNYIRRGKDLMRFLSVSKEPVPQGNNPPGPYYIPRGRDGKPAVFLKAVPKVDEGKCTGCGTCAEICPMGSIDFDYPNLMTGICIKCQACIKSCPAGARFFDDEVFLSHRDMLTENYSGVKNKDQFFDYVTLARGEHG